MFSHIDALPPRAYPLGLGCAGRPQRPVALALALTLALGAAAGCAAQRKVGGSESPAPTAGATAESAAPAGNSAGANVTTGPDEQLARDAIAATAPRSPRRLVFAWALKDRDARFNGQGVARVEPPYRARLDLFGPRGEGYVSAAAVGAELRIPPAAQSQAAMLPPPALLWTALGVLNPPGDARLTGASRQGDETRLEFARGGERWRFTLVGGRLRRAELDGAGPGRQTVELSGEGALGLPRSAVYRDYAEFRELTLTLDRANEAESFPPETWSPGGR